MVLSTNKSHNERINITSPKIEKAFSKSSFVTKGDKFFTLIAALCGADLTRNVRPFSTFPSSSRFAFSEFER